MLLANDRGAATWAAAKRALGDSHFLGRLARFDEAALDPAVARAAMRALKGDTTARHTPPSSLLPPSPFFTPAFLRS